MQHSKYNIIFLFVLAACVSSPSGDIDLSCFEGKEWCRKSNRKFVTWGSVHNLNDTGLPYCCYLYKESLEKFMDSPSVDICFIIDANARDSTEAKRMLEGWCFKNYVFTYSTPRFFSLAKRQGVKAISYMFTKEGKVIELTNPTLPNFKRLMEEQ